MRDYSFSKSDIEEIEGGPNKKLLPDGQYLAGVVDLAMMPYKNLDGEYLSVTFEVMHDEYDGLRLYEIFNLFHPTSKKAVNFSKYKFAELVKSTGLNLEDFENFNELLNKTTIVKVYTESSKEWGDKNKIDQFFLGTDPKKRKANTSKVDSDITDIPW